MTTRLVAVLVAWLVLTACGNPEPYDFYATYDAPDGELRLRYLSPPWELALADGPNVRLEIDNNVPGEGDAGSPLPPKYVLEVSLGAGATLAAAQDAERRARRRGEEITIGVREVETNAGDGGHELFTTDLGDRTRFYRTVFIARRGGHVRLAFASSPPLDEPEIDAMVAALEVDL
jgi:hypothetical protein